MPIKLAFLEKYSPKLTDYRKAKQENTALVQAWANDMEMKRDRGKWNDSILSSLTITWKQEVMEKRISQRWIWNFKSETETDLSEGEFRFRHEYEISIRRNPRLNVQ